MKVYYSIAEIPPIKNAVLTLGTFDGVHLGHQQVIAFLKQSAQAIDGETVLFTFHPHPRMVLHPDDHGMKLIQSIDARIEKLAEYGIDHLILFPFTKEFSRLSATEFVRDILVNKININLMTIGYNHHFGKNREGNLDSLKTLGETYGFAVQEIPAFQKESINISSTKIRKAIEAGEILKANRFLGSVFKFDGTVEKGDQIGTKIGFPTANIKPDSPNQIIPLNGVYVVRITIGDKLYGGMMNIGTRPTVTDSEEKRIEVNLFNFNEMIYGSKITVSVLERIRAEKPFVSIEALQEQLENDKTTSLHFLDQFSDRN